MADYYVATTGSNAAAGAIGTPWMTLTYALTQVGAGDTIHMRAGDYAENVSITTGGSSGSILTIKAYDGGSGAETVWLTGNNYTLPTGDSYVGGTNGYGTWYAANYTGIIDCRASYVTIDGINIKESHGRGIEFYISTWEGGAHITDVTVQNLTISGMRQAGLVGQGADNITISNVVVTDTGNYAPFHRPTQAGQPGNHPAAVNFKYCDGITITNLTVYGCWGEGIIFSMETYNYTLDGFICYDCMSNLLYIHRCEDGTVKNFILYYSDSGTSGASSRGAALTFNNEDPKFSETSYCNNIKIYNGLIVNPERAISILGGDGGTIPFADLKLWNITIVNPTADDPASTTPLGIRIASQAQLSGIEFANIIVHATDTTVQMTESPSRTGLVTWRYNNFHRSPDTDTQGTGDIYSNPLLVNPDVAVVAGAINPANYKLTTASPGRFAGLTIATVTDDYFGDSRAAPYSMGFHQAGASGGGGGDPDPGGTPTGDLEFGIARATVPTSIGSTSLTDANMTLTPKAAIVFANKASSITAGLAEYAHASLSIGFYDGTTQAVFGIRSRDAQATSDARARGSTDMTVMLLNDGSTSVDGELSGAGFSTGAVSLSAAGAPTNAINAMAMLFAGTDFEAQVNTHAFASTDTSKVVSGLSWQPNLFFAISSEAIIDDSPYANATIIFGMATGASVKYSYAFFSDSGEVATATGSLLSNAGLIESHFDNQIYNVTPASDGYTITRTGDNGARSVVVMACQVANASVSLSVEDMPIATGNDSYSLGFTPSIGMIIATLAQAINTDYTDTDASGFGVGMFTANDEHAMAYVDEDAAAPTDTEAVYSESSIITRQVVGTDAYKAAWSSFDTSGLTLTYSDVLGTARKMMLMAIEQVVNASISVDFTADVTSGVAPLTVTYSATATPTNTTVTTHNWTFGDGGTDTVEDPVYIYTAAGTYSVTYTASDGVVSGSKTRTNYITVTDPAPTPPSIGYVVGGVDTTTTTELAIRGGGIELSAFASLIPLASDGFDFVWLRTDGRGHAAGIASYLNTTAGMGGNGLAWSKSSGSTWITTNGRASASVLGASTAYAYIDSGKANVRVQANTIRGGGGLGILLRWVDSSNYAYARNTNTNLGVFEVIAGAAASTLYDSAGTIVSDATLAVEVTGNAWTLEYNGSTITTGSFNAALAAGTKHGLWTNNIANTFDNFQVYDLATYPNGSYVDTSRAYIAVGGSSDMTSALIPGGTVTQHSFVNTNSAQAARTSSDPLWGTLGVVAIHQTQFGYSGSTMSAQASGGDEATRVANTIAGENIDFTAHDATLTLLAANGVTDIVLKAWGYPLWMLDAATGPDAVNRTFATTYRAEAAAFTRAFIKRYNTDSTIAGISIIAVDWGHEWKGSYSDDQARFVADYNAIYAAVKAEDSGVLVGGPYRVLRGNGTVNFGQADSPETREAIISDDGDKIAYFIANATDFDFLSFDAKTWVDDAPTLTYDEAVQMFGYWARYIEKMKTIAGYGSEPLMLSEGYGININDYADFTEAEQGALHSLMLWYSVRHGVSYFLQWIVEKPSGLTKYGYWNSTDDSPTSNVTTTPLYDVHQAYNGNFGAGVDCYPVTITGDASGIYGLASATKLLLINLRATSRTVQYNSINYSLSGYETRVITR